MHVIRTRKGRKGEIPALGFFLLFCSLISAALAGCGEKQAARRDLPTDEANVTVLQPELDSARTLLRLGALEEANAMARLVMDSLGTDLRWSTQQLLALSVLGQVQERLSAPDSAAKLYQEGLRIATAVGDSFAIGGMWLNLGSALQKQGDYNGSLQAGLEGLRFKEAVDDPRGQARSLHNLSLLYWRQNDLPSAIAMLQRSIAIKRIHDSTGVANSLNGLAVLLIEAQRPDTALLLLRESIRLDQRLKPGSPLSGQYSNMGLAFEALHQPDSALLMYRKSMQGSDELIVVHSLLGIGEALMEQGLNAAARAPLDSSLALAEQLGWPENQKEAHRSIARQREAVGDTRAALLHYKAFQQLSDSLMNAAKDAAMNELRVRYDTEHKEQENQQLRSAKLLTEVRAERNRWAAIGIGILALVIILLAWALTMRNRHKAALREAELEQQALRLQMDPHFLFNALNTVPGLYASGDAAAANDHVGHLSQFLRMVLETSRRRTISVAQELQLVEHYLRISANRRPGTLSWTIEVMPEVPAERIAIPPMLVQPVVENAVEHGLAGVDKGHIRITVSKRGELLHVEVQDNGKGRKAAALRPSRHQGRSLGIGLVSQRIALFDRRAPRNAVSIQDDTDTQGHASGTTVTLQFHTKFLNDHVAHRDRG